MSGGIDINEFTVLQLKAFKNCEDNIEFLVKDIQEMDSKIKEVKEKMRSLKERETG